MMSKAGLALGMVSVVLGAAWTAQADFALKGDDRVAFFGNKVLEESALPMGVESFVRIRYPELKTRFRTYGRHTAAILRDAGERFEREVLPEEPTVVVLCFGTDDVPQREFNEHHFRRFQPEFAALVEQVNSTAGVRLYVMTPMCPEPARKPALEAMKYAQTVERYADAMRAIAQQQGVPVIDWFAASKAYLEERAGDKRVAITRDGAFPSTLGYAIGMTATLDAWAAEPCNIAVESDWKSGSASASIGQASITKLGDDTIQLALSGMPIPWVVPNRGTVTDENWPGTRYYTFMLRVANAPPEGIIIRQSDKPDNYLPYLSEQLWEGVNLGFVGPLSKLDAVAAVVKRLKDKYDYERHGQSMLRRPVLDPEYRQAQETYCLSLKQYADGADEIVQRLPRTVDVTLELTKASLQPPESGEPPQTGKVKPSLRPAKQGPPDAPGQNQPPPNLPDRDDEADKRP